MEIYSMKDIRALRTAHQRERTTNILSVVVLSWCITMAILYMVYYSKGTDQNAMEYARTLDSIAVVYEDGSAILANGETACLFPIRGCTLDNQ